MQIQKISFHTPLQKGLEFPVRLPKAMTDLKKCIELDWNFHRGGGPWKISLLWRKIKHHF